MISIESNPVRASAAILSVGKNLPVMDPPCTDCYQEPPRGGTAGWDLAVSIWEERMGTTLAASAFAVSSWEDSLDSGPDRIGGGVAPPPPPTTAMGYAVLSNETFLGCRSR